MLFIAFRGFRPRPVVIFLQVMVMDFLLAGVSLGQVPTETQEAASSVMASASFGSAEPAAMEWVYWAILLAASLTALGFAFSFFRKMKEADPGNDRMVEIANYVTVGAKAYLKQQYFVVSIYFAVVFLLLMWARNAGIQQYWVPIAFLTGGFWSGLAGYIGMTTATAASSRTAAGAMKSLNDGLQVAFRSGAVMGLTVVGLARWTWRFGMAFYVSFVI